MSDEECFSFEVPAPAKLIPTIGQLFKRSFSQELEDCRGEQFLLLDQRVNNFFGDDYFVLEDINSIKRNATKVLLSVSTSDFQQCFQEWRARWSRCVESQGSYFDGQ